MSLYLLMTPQAPRDDLAVAWCLADTDGHVHDQDETPPDELAQRLPSGAQPWLLLPPGEVTVHRATLPTRNRQKARQALPWVLEEHLAADPDELHFALGGVDEQGRHAAAVIDSQRMAAWVEWARRHQLEPRVVTPLELVLASEPQHWRLLLDAESGWLSMGPGCALALDAAIWPVALPRLVAEVEAEKDLPECLTVHPVGASADQLARLKATLPDSVRFSQEPDKPCHLPALASAFAPGQAINLLQGPFSGREQWLRRLRPWRAVAGLGLAWVGLQFLLLYAEVRDLEQTEQALRAETVELYRSAFPDSRVVNPRVQMQRALADLASDTDDDGPRGTDDTFTALLGVVAPTLVGDDAPRLQSLAFRQQRLELELDATGVQALEALREAIQEQGDWRVQIHSASSRGDRVASRVTVQGGES